LPKFTNIPDSYTLYCQVPSVDNKERSPIVEHPFRDNPRYTQTYINDPQIHRKLDLDQPVAFIIHGWYDNVDRAWLKETAQDYIRYANTNVCAVNWNAMALNRYGVSASHTDGVARITTQFVNYLVASGFKLDRMTLVGHSMGAHIAGMVGHSTSGKIGQIIGLDPAGPMFTTVSPRPISRRLDQTSAQFVQVIHTDKYAIGTAMNLGHQDFFPNDGATPQPGCVAPVVQKGAMGYSKCSKIHKKTS
jgi:pimeloyl-ACP methyl ester carboxylesterase